MAGYESGYLAENMGTVFVFAHFIALFYLITAGFYLCRNASKTTHRIYGYLSHKLFWNFLIVFLMESYIEIAISSISVMKRWKYDFEGDFNDKANVIYSMTFLLIIFLFPFFLAVLYCCKRKQLDRTAFRNKYGGPLDGLKRHHKQRLIFYVVLYLARRFGFVFFLVNTEGSFLLSMASAILTTEISMSFLLMTRPFDTQFRNFIEVFNEAVLFIILFLTLCFTDVMSPEGQEVIGFYLIGLIGLYLLVHLYSLFSDSVSKICLIIWR